MSEEKQIGFFEKYLTIWVKLCIVAGIGLGHFNGDSVQFLSEMEIYKVNIPVAILIWLMIYPMMLQIDFSRLISGILHHLCLNLFCSKVNKTE